MRPFMDYVHGAFYQATGWSRDNSYVALNQTTDALLDFQTPRGLQLALSSLASSNFATFYQLGSVGVVDGSISYLYSSVPLRPLLEPKSQQISLPELLRAWKPLVPLPMRSEGTSRPEDKPATSLLYGRLYLPESLLEALFVRRISPALQVQFSAVSAAHLRNGGTAVGLAQYDVGKYAIEGLASSDGGLLGLRGVYNFGGDVENPAPTTTEPGGNERERIYGRFSTGAEIYYGTLNKSGGMSIGTRFATLPQHRGTPLSATLTLTPLMGNISASYAVVAGKHCSLATRFSFNAFSYESAWAVGMELWRNPVRWVGDDNHGMFKRSFQSKLEWKLDEPEVPKKKKGKNNNNDANSDDGRGSGSEEEYSGVLRTRLNQDLKIGVVWEGRVKSLLFSLGSSIDLKRLDKPFRTLGLEIQFSS